MKSSELLKASLKYLSDGTDDSNESLFVCTAVWRAAYREESEAAMAACGRISQYICSLLGTCTHVSEWLVKNVIGYYPPATELQAYRKRWVEEALIPYFQSIGD